MHSIFPFLNKFWFHIDTIACRTLPSEDLLLIVWRKIFIRYGLVRTRYQDLDGDFMRLLKMLIVTLMFLFGH